MWILLTKRIEKLTFEITSPCPLDLEQKERLVIFSHHLDYHSNVYGYTWNQPHQYAFLVEAGPGPRPRT
jgi:hypothetical protein